MSKLEIKYAKAESEIDSLADFVAPAQGYVMGIEVGIGPEGKNAADIFSFTICDEKGFNSLLLGFDSEYKSKGISCLQGYHLFVMKSYDYGEILKYIDNIIKSVPPDLSWKQQGMVLSKYFYWEYYEETISSMQ